MSSPDRSSKSPWQSLFETMRPADVKCLMVNCVGGLQISLQELVAVDEGMAILRGRVSGEADSGRLFLVPIDNILGVYVNRSIRREETELFLPSVSREQKEEVARKVRELEQRERDDADAGGPGDQSQKSDVRRQLEALREEGGFGGDRPKPEPKKIAPAAGDANKSGVSRLRLPSRPGS